MRNEKQKPAESIGGESSIHELDRSYEVMLGNVVLSRESFQFFQPILVVSRIFGLCPVSCKNDGSKVIVGWSTLFAIYSYLLSINFVIASIIGLVNDIDEGDSRSFRMKMKKGRFITCCDVIIIILIVIFGTVTLPCRMRRFWDILRNFNKTDSALVVPNLKGYRRQSMRMIIAVYCIFTFVMVFDVFYWTKCSGEKSGGQYILRYMGFYLLYYIIITLELYFSHLVYSIHIKLDMINEHLVIDGNAGNNSKNNVIIMNSQIDNFHREMYEFMRPKDSEIFFKIKISKARITDAQRIEILRKLHKQLNHGVKIINETIANGIMLIMLSCLVHLVVTPYFLVAELIKEKTNYLFIFLQIIWIITHICRLLIIVEPCQACSLEGQRTNMLLCDLLGLSSADGEFQKAVDSFSIYLSQNQIKFSCSGLFTIDRSVITSIAGSVTTYIVILFQFNNN